jgi:hypothetical protein
VKVLKASLTGTYDIVDRTGKVIDSGDLNEDFSRKYDEGKNSATPSKVEEDLIFETFIPLAESNTWDRYLAAVEAVSANRNASQEGLRPRTAGVFAGRPRFVTGQARLRSIEWRTDARRENAVALLAVSTDDPRRATELLQELNNQTLLSMAQAGMTDENLILAIDDADEVAFDTTPNALISLAKGGVSRNVIAHMQRRAKK